jgi:hypothetical protein
MRNGRLVDSKPRHAMRRQRHRLCVDLTTTLAVIAVVVGLCLRPLRFCLWHMIFKS